MQDTGEAQGAETYGVTIRIDVPEETSIFDFYAAMKGLFSEKRQESLTTPRAVLSAVIAEIIRLREYAALPAAAETPETTPGWRELSYEEPPYGKSVLFRRGGKTPYVGYSVKPDLDDPDGDHGLLIRIDGDLYDGDPPEFWSEIPDYYYDDVAAIAQTLDGDDDSDDDADTAEEGDDDSEAYYRDIDDPPPVDVPVLLLALNSEGAAKEPFIGWRDEDGAYCTDDGGEVIEVDAPDYWSFLPRLPALNS